MPELPEAENVRLSLIPHLKKKNILFSETIDGRVIRQENKSLLSERLMDISIEEVYRRGKYIIIRLLKDNQNFYFTIHLRMTGVVRIISKLNELDDILHKHLNLIIHLDDNKLMTYSDKRKFGDIRVLNEKEFSLFKSVQNIGPEVFWKDGLDLFLSIIKRTKYQKKSIKSVILNQEIIAGVGNIYANEVMWYRKIHPMSFVGNLNDTQLKDIFFELKRLFEFSIQVGGSSISDYMDANGQKGHFQEYFKVYKQAECESCSSQIVTMKIDGRSSFCCEKCQVLY